jgi:hypothetical protein
MLFNKDQPTNELLNKDKQDKTLLANDIPTVHIKTDDVHVKLQPPEKSEVFEAVTKIVTEGKEALTNEDLDSIGDYLQKILESVEGSGKGKRIADDAKGIVKGASRWIREKNYDSKLQEALLELGNAGVVGSEPLSEMAQELMNALNNAAPKITKLAQSIINDREFREYLVELFEIFQTKFQQIDTEGLEQAVKQDFIEGDTENMERKGKKEKKRAEKLTELTDEEQEEIKYRSAELIVNLRSKRSYNDYVEMLFDLLDDLSRVYRVRENNVKLESAKQETNKALSDIKILMERMANCSLDPLMENLEVLYSARHDQFFWDLRNDIRDLLLDPNGKYPDTDSTYHKLNEIYGKIDGFNQEYENVFENVMYEAREVFDGIMNDPIMRQFSNDWERLFNDVLKDDFGNISFSSALDSFNVFHRAILPMIRNRLEAFQLPNIEIDSPKYTYSMRNVWLSLNDLLPQRVQFRADTVFDIEPGKDIDGKSELTIRFHPFSFTIENMEFYYKSKNMFRYEDYGNLRLGASEGWTEMRMNFVAKDGIFLVEYLDTNVVLNNFWVDIIESKHDILNSLFYNVFRPATQTRMENTLAEAYTMIGKTICAEINNMATSSLEKNKKIFREIKETNLGDIPENAKLAIGVGDEEIPFIQKQIVLE